MISCYDQGAMPIDLHHRNEVSRHTEDKEKPLLICG